MARDHSEIRERLDYCEAELHELYALIAAFLKSSIRVRHFKVPGAPYRWMGPTETTLSISAWPTMQVPVAIRSKAGMIANEIRSCLDGLACDLALRNGKTVAKVLFPISASQAVFEEDGIGKIKKLSPEDQAKIADLRPYPGGNDVLVRLHESDKRRKHQRLSPAGAATGGFQMGGFGVTGNIHLMIDHCMVGGVPVNEVRYNGVQALTDIGKEVVIVSGVPLQLAESTRFQSTLVYEAPTSVAGAPVMLVLQEALEEVRRIVDLFSADGAA